MPEKYHRQMNIFKMVNGGRVINLRAINWKGDVGSGAKMNVSNDLLLFNVLFNTLLIPQRSR